MEAGTKTTASHQFEVKNDVEETDIKKMLLAMYQNDFTEPTLEKGKQVLKLLQVTNLR